MGILILSGGRRQLAHLRAAGGLADASEKEVKSGGTRSRLCSDETVGLGRLGPFGPLRTSLFLFFGFLEAGAVKCWGSGDFDQLGRGFKAPQVRFGGRREPEALPNQLPSSGLLGYGLCRLQTFLLWGLNTSERL